MTPATVRILLRYGVGALVGRELGEVLAGDADVVLVCVTVGTFVVAEGWYFLAKRYGWRT